MNITCDQCCIDCRLAEVLSINSQEGSTCRCKAGRYFYDKPDKLAQ